jgi:diguanylate cyclase (GGDEF)-like protein/PAS domain S-box-containing protein
VSPETLRILVADDEQTILDLYQAVLSSQKKQQQIVAEMEELETKLFGEKEPDFPTFSCELVKCQQGPQAVEMVKMALESEQPFAVAFLDVRMPPGPDGIWTAEQIRALDPFIEIVIVTAYADITPKDFAHRIPPAHRLLYLQKPLHAQEIYQFVSALGAKWYTEQALRNIHAELENRIAQRTHEFTLANQQLREDIVQREKVEKALLESESKYRELFENAHDLIQSVAPDGHFLFVNSAWLHTFGFTREELSGLHLFDLIHPESLTHCQTLFLKVMQGEALHNIEAKFLTRKGQTIIVEGNAVPRIVDGHVVATHGFFRDVTIRKQAEEHLQQLKKAIQTMQLGVIITDLDGRISYINVAGAEMHGYQVEELFGQDISVLSAPALRRSLTLPQIKNWKGLIRESMNIRKDGVTFPVWLMSEVVQDARGEPSAIVTSCENITERKQAEEALRRSEERYRIVLESAPEPVVVYDMEKRIVYFNPAFSRVFGWTLEESFGEMLDFIPLEKSSEAEWLFEKISSGEIISGIETHRLTRDGNRVEVSISGAGFFDRHGRLQGSVLTLQDITLRKRTEEEINFLAYHDILTRLPNRRSFYLRLEDKIVQSHNQDDDKRRAKGHKWALLFLDLDRFKDVNDTLGHDVGDEVLKLVAARIENFLRKSDYIFRLGGDEFTIILNDLIDSTDVAKVADKIRKEISLPYSIKNHPIYITGSIGISIYPDDGSNVESLVKNADMAMYAAKEAKQGYRFFTEEMNKKALERMILENNLRNALQHNQFVLFYQPMVDNRNQIVEVEALLRWRHPELGMINPAQFIPLAEETGMIIPIGKWVLHTACQQISLWHQKGYSDLCGAINLSTRQFKEPDLVDMIEQVLQLTGLPPECLKLELTESGIMENPEQAIAKMQNLRAKGIHFSIDDFGTGYSSLNYLKRFPIDTLKIDRSFVADCITDKDDQEIIKTIIAMARNLNMNTVAEGVETKEQLEFLIRHECQVMQGYYFGRPMPADEFEKCLQCRSLIGAKRMEH